MDSTQLRHILTRHEQGAGHAAQGYAHATGRTGACIVTSGPGATNLVTPIADANMDSIPMVAITGQVAASFIGTDAFQEADIVGITAPITKHNMLIKDAADIAPAIAQAFYIASHGRPGPVLVDIAKSAMQARTTFHWPERIELPGFNSGAKPHVKTIQEAARLLATVQAARAVRGRRRDPLGGVGGAAQARRPVRRGRGDHPHGARRAARQPPAAPGHARNARHGARGGGAAEGRPRRVSLGARFDDRVTGKLDSFAPNAVIVHADIDPAEIGKNKAVDVPIVGDLKDVFQELVPALHEEHRKHGKPDLGAWWAQLDQWRATYPLGYAPTHDGLSIPQHVIQRLGELNDPMSTIFTSGVGQHQMWASQFIKYERPNTWINSGGLGTMGFAVPAAMGAKVGMPDQTVWAIDGDGCFQMTNQELTTCALNNIPIKVAIINNSSLGMVRQWQTLFYEGRYSNTDLNTGHGTARIPDFVKLADAMGCVGLRCESDADVDATIKRANEINDQPVVVDFTVSKDAMVWPMVNAGVSNDEIQYARGVAPEWDREEA